MFIIAEHLMLMVVFFVASLTPPISGHTALVMRQHTIARAKLLGSVHRHIDVQKGTIGAFASDQSVSEGGWEEFPSVFVPPYLAPRTLTLAAGIQGCCCCCCCFVCGCCCCCFLICILSACLGVL
mmetsp:Transcript_15148/g.39185  ORF Transcript_15148/g.39185 Transcript_15148/m.39185 type:complete len:125 (+) Transcript_15148:1-375(+)